MESSDKLPKEPQAALSPADKIGEMLVGFQATQVVYTAAKLRIFEVLQGGSKTAHEIAVAVGAHEQSLRRLLRFLITLDMVTEDDHGRLAATSMGDLLRADHPETEYPWAILLGSPPIWQSWGDLYQSVVTGQPAFDRIFGKPFFEYLGQSPEDAAVFNAAMTSTIPSMLFDVYDFSAFAKIVDVGGGQGALLRTILQKYPYALGVLYDLPSVVADAYELKDSEVAGRCEIIGGDMFQSIPEGGDAYILKRIVHDWSDAESIQILRNCRQAMGDGGRILLIESIVQPSSVADSSASRDLMMLVLSTGRERTEHEFQQLLAAAGLKLIRVLPLGQSWIIEAIPV